MIPFAIPLNGQFLNTGDILEAEASVNLMLFMQHYPLLWVNQKKMMLFKNTINIMVTQHEFV